MPAGIRFGAAEMSQRLLLLFRGHLRRLAGVKADENNFVVAAGIEADHPERADDALFDLIAKHGTTVINEGEDHRLLLPEVVAQLDAAAGFVAERKIQRHWRVKCRLESHVSQRQWHGRGGLASIAGDGLRAQSERREEERRSPDDMASFIHFIISFSPSQTQGLWPNSFRR